MKKLLLSLVLLSSTAIGYCQSKVVVELDFGGNKPAECKEVQWSEGMTALVALQQCATIATHPVGKEYIFVTTIEGVTANPKKTAWYYKVNGISPRKLAYRNVVNPSDTITWIYKTDVCSATKEQ